MAQQCVQDRHHAAAQHDHGHVVGSRPHHEVSEVGVELDVLQQDLEDFGERHLPRVQHLLECVTEGIGLVDHGVEELPSCFFPHAIVVRDVVVGVLERDGTVKVGEEDHLWSGIEGFGERHLVFLLFISSVIGTEAAEWMLISRNEQCTLRCSLESR